MAVRFGPPCSNQEQLDDPRRWSMPQIRQQTCCLKRELWLISCVLCSIGWLQKLPELCEPRLQFIWRKDYKKLLREKFRLNWVININRNRYEICRGKLRYLASVKINFGRERYLELLTMKQAAVIFNFWASNHNLPIERDRYLNIPEECRLCNKCEGEQVGP